MSTPPAVLGVKSAKFKKLFCCRSWLKFFMMALSWAEAVGRAAIREEKGGAINKWWVVQGKPGRSQAQRTFRSD